MKSLYNLSQPIVLILFVFLISPQFASAQGVVNDGAKINISSGTFLNIDGGGFTNETGGTVANAGTMEVEGDWENNDNGGVFLTTATSGVVALDGGAQNLSGSDKTNFYNLTIEGSDKKTLNAVDADVYNTLTLSFQSIRLNSQTLTLENQALGPAAISNLGGFIISESAPSSGGYGVLKWDVGTQVANYTVPFGTDDASPTNLAFEYNITTAGSPTSDYKTFATYGTDDYNSFDEVTFPNITAGPYPSGAWSDLPTTVNHLTDDYIQAAHRWVADRFWIIDEGNIGEGNGGYGVNPRSEYVFKYATADIDGAINHITESNLIAQRYNHDLDKWGDWIYGVPAVITNPATNTVTIQIGQDPTTSDEDMYPVWTLVDNSDPLPIELIRFVGECANGKIDLKWTTWTETNNDFFTVEKSSDGAEWEIVDVIEGAGNSNEPISYEAIDNLPYGGTSYYRLKNTDFAGKTEYSDVLAVTCGSDENDFNFVNAYDVDHSELVIEFTSSENEDFTIMLYDASGRRLQDYGGTGYDGLNKVRLDVADLARGIYIVNLSNGVHNYSKRVMLK